MEVVLQQKFKDNYGNEWTEEQATIIHQLSEDMGYSYQEAVDIVLEFVTPEECQEEFSVHDMSSANWVLRKIAEAEESIKEINAMVDAEVQAIKAKGDKLLGKHTAKIAFFRGQFDQQLQDWAAEELKDKKSKSINLIHGKVGFRKTPDVVNIIDEEQAISIARINDIPDVISESIRKAELKKLLSDDEQKQLFEGVAEIIAGEDKFYLTIDSALNSEKGGS